jgi:hypothetical protein
MPALPVGSLAPVASYAVRPEIPVTLPSNQYTSTSGFAVEVARCAVTVLPCDRPVIRRAGPA